MGKIALLIFVLLIGALAFLSISNTDMTTVNVPFDKTYEISKIGLILASSAAGALAVLMVYMLRDTRRMVVTYQFKQKRKKEGRIQDNYARALNAVMAKDSAAATKLLEGILKDEPEHPDALLRLGDVSAADERHEEAQRYYKKALSASPGNQEALFSLAALARGREKWSEALDYLQDVLDIDSSNMSALTTKREVLEHTSSWEDLLDVQKAVMRYERSGHDMAAEESRLIGYRYELAVKGLGAGELEKAEKGFRNILRADPEFVPAAIGLAETLSTGGDQEGAVSFLEKTFKETSSPLILARLEDVLISAGEPSRLIRTYRNAVLANPANPTLRFLLGKLYYRLEMVDDAIVTLTEGEVPEGFPEWHRLLGELYLRRNQCESAVEEFRRSVDMSTTLRLPYTCGDCGTTSTGYSGKCPECGYWNTLKFDLHGDS